MSVGDDVAAGVHGGGAGRGRQLGGGASHEEDSRLHHTVHGNRIEEIVADSGGRVAIHLVKLRNKSHLALGDIPYFALFQS